MRLFVIATTDFGFVWMIKAEYAAEFMDVPPGFADRLDEISCSSEACPAA